MSSGSSIITIASAIAALTSFAKTCPLCMAFLSCAANGVAADMIAQRSEAVGRRSAAARRSKAVATDPMILPMRKMVHSGAAYVSTSNSTTSSCQHRERGDNTILPMTVPLHSTDSDSLRPSTVSFNWDPKRSLAFLLYGGCYQGIACHIFYNVLFLRWFGPNNVVMKVAVSQFIMAPLLTLPCAYIFKGMVFGKTIMQTLKDYWIGVTRNGLLFSFWKLWIPVQFLIFAVIPPHWRMPFSSFFSFLWTVILSRITSNA